MPSFDRLLILSVLALAASSISAPVQDTNPGHSLVPADGGLVHVPGVNQGDVPIALSANEDDADDYDFDEEDSILERRAAKTTKKAPKPKITKVAKPKTTKVAKPKTTKVAKPKTIKAKTVAKATPTTHAKPTKVKTTAKPTKSAKATAKPAKTKTTKPATKTSSATGAAKPSACPIKKPAKKHKFFASRAYDYISSLFKRDAQEFIGWHGTNSNTAAFWKSIQGQVKKPPAGGSGAGAILGPGLYITDDKETAASYAVGNSANNKGTTPALCAIFATSSANWRTVIRKAFIPEALKGSSAEKEKQRIAYIKDAVPGVHAETVVRFAIHDPKNGIGEMVIPSSDLTEKLGHFVAKCFTVDPKTGQVVDSDRAASSEGTTTFPELSYDGARLRQEWNITPEQGGAPAAPACG